jgi:Na+/H+-dicarboxylate symporter
MQAFGRLVESDASAETRISLLTPYAGSHENVAISLIMRMVPDNIFSSLSAGDTLKTLIFVLFFGISLASVRKGSNSLVDACEVTSLACQKMMFWVLYALPFASFALAADQVASNGVEPFKVMGRFIVALSVVAVVLMFLCITVIWFKAKTSLADVLRSQQRPFFVAAATRSTVACMPSMTFAMSELGFSKAMSELLVPLGTALFRVGPVVYYCMATIFIAQLYGRNMSIPDYGLVLVASLIVGFSSSGMSGIATISQTTIVCSLMGLPFEAALVLFIAVEPVCDTLRTILAVLSIDSLVALIAPLEREACEPALARITAASLA